MNRPIINNSPPMILVERDECDRWASDEQLRLEVIEQARSLLSGMVIVATIGGYVVDTIFLFKNELSSGLSMTGK